MSVIISMALAVLIWSLYPLAAAMGLKDMGSLEMILIVYFFSGFGALLMGGYYLFKEKKIGQAIAIQKSLKTNAYITAFVSGLSGILCHSFFIISLTLADKGGVSLLYESWPVIAVIATPFLMQKAWKEVSFKEFMISIVALVGVAIIILSDKSINSNFEEFNMAVLGGYILAFAGGYMCAILVVTKARYAEHFQSMNDDVATTMISEIVSRIISMLLILVTFVILQENLDWANINWWASFYIGFVVFVVGGALYTFGILKSTRPTIHIIYYFVPILAVFWLYFAGETSMNWGILLGGVIIVVCNIYLAIASRKAKMSKAY